MADRKKQIEFELCLLKLELNAFYGAGPSEIIRTEKIFNRVRELRAELKNLNLSNENNT